jgi:hypothetical protein
MNLKSMRREVGRLQKVAGVTPLPLDQWGEKEFLSLARAFEAGAEEVRLHRVSFTRAQWMEIVRLWDGYRLLENAVACDQVAGLAEARGETGGLAAVLRQQAAEWRAKAELSTSWARGCDTT